MLTTTRLHLETKNSVFIFSHNLGTTIMEGFSYTTTDKVSCECKTVTQH